MRKLIISGIGILIILLALAGTASAKQSYTTADCSYCHVGIVDGDYSLTSDGSYFREVHKFNGVSVPNNAQSCLKCHNDLSEFLPLTSVGSSYNASHRYNATTLAAKMLTSPGCANCHVNAINNNFTLLTGTPTYAGSETCENCHKAKYDKWSNTLHAVMLTPRVDAEAMDLPLPVGATWDDIGFVRITKASLAYVNTTGYFLPGNYSYNTITQTFTGDSYSGGAYGTCASCHTVGWNGSAVNTEYPGIAGTFAEAGIGCERCHGATGIGHQVTVDYSSNLCIDCHSGSKHGTGWEDGAHAPPAARNGASCTQCHSPFDKYTNDGTASIEDSINVACGVCHDIHDMTDDLYADTFADGVFNATEWSVRANAKLSFFNGTASMAAGTDVFDDLYAESASTGVDEATILCSKCHVPRHGLGHTNMPFTNLSHGRASAPATCIDCHMEGASATVGKDMMNNHANEIVDGASCGVGACHRSMTVNFAEWKATAHNVKEVGVGDGYNHYYGHINETTGGSDNSRNPSCNKCHDPLNYDPRDDSATENEPLSENFKGVYCTVCHPIHDMGNWLAATEAEFGNEKAYGLFTKILDGTRYRNGYTMVENTTALCGSCHASVRIGRSEAGWSSNTATTPNKTHGFPAKDLFVGSWKQTSLLEFECTSCHLATMKRYANGTRLPNDQRNSGHSFQVNTTILQNNAACSSCHVTGSALGNISTTIKDVQTRIKAKYNVTNQIVTDALAEVNAYSGEKNMSREKIAQAYWNKQLVSSDESWGAHNPAKVDQLLDDAVTLAHAANASLGQASTSSVQLKAGWNLVSLIETPSNTATVSVLSSVSSSITVVWGFNAASQTWELYDPAMPANLQTLKTMVPGKGYWIKATQDIEWTV